MNVQRASMFDSLAKSRIGIINIISRSHSAKSILSMDYTHLIADNGTIKLYSVIVLVREATHLILISMQYFLELIHPAIHQHTLHDVFAFISGDADQVFGNESDLCVFHAVEFEVLLLRQGIVHDSCTNRLAMVHQLFYIWRHLRPPLGYLDGTILIFAIDPAFWRVFFYLVRGEGLVVWHNCTLEAGHDIWLRHVKQYMPQMFQNMPPDDRTSHRCTTHTQQCAKK